MKSIVQAWSQSKAYRIILIISLVYALLRLAMHFTYITVMATPSLWPEEAPAAEGPAIPADLHAYLDAAQRFRQRENLYVEGAFTQLEGLYQYAPSFAMALGFLLLGSPVAVAILHSVLNIAAYGLLYVRWHTIFRRLGWDRPREVLAWVLPVWLVFSAFWSDLGYLNIYILTALLSTLLIDAVSAESLGWSLLWLSIILQVKPMWGFAIGLPLLMGRYRFFLKLIVLAIVIYLAVVGTTMVIAGPVYGWQQHMAYFRFLTGLRDNFPWRGPDRSFLGYNHSITQIVVYLAGVTPGAMCLATGIKVLLLVPLVVICLRYVLYPARQVGRDGPQLSLDFALVLYLGVFIWLDMVWELSLGIAVFTYLLATLKRRSAKMLVWAVFLPYALIDFWQAVTFIIMGEDAISPSGFYFVLDPSIYVPIIMMAILTFYALLVCRLWMCQRTAEATVRCIGE